jgi:hypothetical protein
MNLPPRDMSSPFISPTLTLLIITPHTPFIIEESKGSQQLHEEERLLPNLNLFKAFLEAFAIIHVPLYLTCLFGPCHDMITLF